jgi:hypothetical protein
VIDEEPSEPTGLGVDYGNALGSVNGSSGSDGSPQSAGKRASGPFDLGTPQYSPDIMTEKNFFEDQQRLRDHQDQDLDEVGTGTGTRTGEELEDEHDAQGVEDTRGESQTRVRASVMSTASSEAFGGIGGFMMGHVGNGSLDASGMEALRGRRGHIIPAR